MDKQRILALILGLIVLLPNQLYAKDDWQDWRGIENDYFRIYTNAKDKRVLKLLEELEKFRLVAEQAIVVKVPKDAPKSRIVLFKSRRQFLKYTWHKRLAGYVTGLDNIPYAVLSASKRTLDNIILHEYVHVVQGYSENRMPRWANEGMAEMIASLVYKGDKGNIAVIGKVNEKRWQYLYKELNYNKLVANDIDPLKRRLGADAYAQYWLLVNYSMTHEDGVYRKAFGRSLSKYYAGMDALTAFTEAYGQDPEHFAAEAMKNYRRKSYGYKGILYVLDLEKIDLDIDVTQPEPGEIQSIMSGLAHIAARTKERAKQK